MRWLFVLAMLALPVAGQYTLYTCMVTSKDYVVGARLPPSGIFLKSGTGEWRHAGYNHPIINALDYNPRDPGTVYVAAGNGLLRVSGRGERWKILTGSDVTELMDVAVDPNAAGTIYFTHSAGIRVTHDLGATWSDASAGLHRKYTQAIRVDTEKMMRLFRHKLFQALLAKEIITTRIVDLLLGWQHAGFSVFRGEPSEPDWHALPTATSSKLKDLLHRCLRKDPRERLHDIADARIEMGEELTEPSTRIPVARRLSLGLLIAVCATTAVIAFLVGLAVMKYSRPATSIPQAVVRFPVRLEPGLWLDGWRRSPPEGFDHPTRTATALSSDGRFIIYAAIKENPGTQDKPQLYLRKLDQLEAKSIAGTEGAISPFLSPDDRWVGFWADGKLMKVSVEGGVAATLCDVPVPFGFSWGVDNQIVFASGSRSGLSRVSSGGGKPKTLTMSDKSKEEYSHRLPHCLPDGKGILFTITRGAFDISPRVAVLELGTGKWRILLEDGADARYERPGHLAFLRQGTLMTVPFDPDRLEITGQAAPAVAAISQALNTGSANWEAGAGQFGISASGALVYASGGIVPDLKNSLVWVDHKGNAEPIASFKAPFFSPRLSPDFQRIAYGTLAKERQVWIYDLNRGTRTRLTSEGIAVRAIWIPDGKRVLFGWRKTGAANIFWQAVDGSSPMERLTQSEYNQESSAFSPDGRTLAFVEFSPSTGADVMLLNMSDRQVTPLLSSRFSEGYPEFSPDGRWIAYASDDSGRFEVYVRPFPGPGGKLPISDEGGTEPLWAGNGKQLFYRRSDQVWAVDVQSGSSFAVGKPRLLFEKPGFNSGNAIRCWDVSPDGQRFLMVKMEEIKPQPITEMIFVQNWFEELKRLVPTGKK